MECKTITNIWDHKIAVRLFIKEICPESFESYPYWAVDLHKPRLIGSIVIYESLNHIKFNVWPFTIAFSNDQKTWRTIETISDERHGSPLIIKLKKPQDTRYILIRASGKCHLSLDEVEIYPATKDTHDRLISYHNSQDLHTIDN